MYKFSYAEILEDAGQELRMREHLAVDHAVKLLTEAEAKGPGSPESLEAMNYLNRLWSFLIGDLADPRNELDEKLRADLISIGLWVMREADAVLQDPSKGYGALIEINRAIRDGLK